MLFGKHINKLLDDFYKENKSIILGTISSSISLYTIESVFIPKIMAQLVSNINDKICFAVYSSNHTFSAAAFIASSLASLIAKIISDLLLQSHLSNISSAVLIICKLKNPL